MKKPTNIIKKALSFIAVALIASITGSSQAATSTNTNTALNWNISSSGWTGVAGSIAHFE